MHYYLKGNSCTFQPGILIRAFFAFITSIFGKTQLLKNESAEASSGSLLKLSKWNSPLCAHLKVNTEIAPLDSLLSLNAKCIVISLRGNFRCIKCLWPSKWNDSAITKPCPQTTAVCVHGAGIHQECKERIKQWVYLLSYLTRYSRNRALLLIH